MKTLKDRYENVGPRWRQDFGPIRRPDMYNEFLFIVTSSLDANSKHIKILGLMAGDAGFELYLANHLKNLGNEIEMDILDFSPAMLEATGFIEGILARKIVDDVRHAKIKDSYDFVVLKFGLHDLPREDQQFTLCKIPSLLSENGILILIAYFSPSREMQTHYNNIVRQKDELAGYKSERHFATLGEIVDMLIKANLKPRIEMLSESKINYFRTELLDSESRKVFNAKLFQMNVFAGVDNLLGIIHTAEGPEITFPLVVLTAKK
jgi:ubiquinone/menaquinone biosynthesis C-methylase UbiE